MPTEADTCRKYVVPKLQAAGWDNVPAFATQEEIDESGQVTDIEVIPPEEPEDTDSHRGNAAERPRVSGDDQTGGPGREYYFDGGHVEIAAEIVHELDADGKQLRVIKQTNDTAEKVRILCTSADDLRTRWADAGRRAEIIQQFGEHGIDFASVAAQAGQPDADPFDLLCHLAFNAPMLTRRQRVDRVKKQEAAFFNHLGPEAREILDDLLEKYAKDGELQFTLPDVLKLPPISHHGNVNEIIGKFGGTEQLRSAVNQLQSLLYAPDKMSMHQSIS